MGNTAFKNDKQGIILGGYQSGKTTLFQNLVLKQFSKETKTEPTHGFNFEGMELKGKNIGIFDIGGSDLVTKKNLKKVLQFMERILQPNRIRLHHLRAPLRMRVPPQRFRRSNSEPNAQNRRKKRQSRRIP
jgi:hypothetical protein